MVVVEQVTDEEQCGYGEGGKHAFFMRLDFLSPNEQIAYRQQNSAEGVEQRVDCW